MIEVKDAGIIPSEEPCNCEDPQVYVGGYCSNCGGKWVKDETKEAVLCCVPVQQSDRMGIEYTPGPEYKITQCEGCNMPVYIGPKQFALKADLPEIPILCPLCAIAHELLH